MVREKNIIPPVYAVALSAAVILYPLSITTVPPLLQKCTALILIVSLGIFCVYNASPREARVLLLCVAFGAGLGTLALIRIDSHRRPLLTLAPLNRIVSFRFVLRSDPQPYGTALYRAEAKGLEGIDGDQCHFSISGPCTIFIPAALVRSAQPDGLSVKEHTAVSFSAGSSLETKGSFQAYQRTEGEVFRVSEIAQPDPLWVHPMYRIRSALRSSLTRLLHDWSSAGGLLLSLLSGNRDYLDTGLAVNFRNAGLAHVLALSGMHLSLIGLIAVKVGRRIGGKRLSIRLSLIAMIFFVWFAGSSPSLHRALLMSLFLLAGRRFGLKASVLPALGAAFCVQIALAPVEALSLAFLLSYGALWGILTVGQELSELCRGMIPECVQDPLFASIGAQMLTTPIIAVSMGTLSPIGILSTCVVSPLISLFMVIGLVLSLASSLMQGLAAPSYAILDLLYRLIVGSVDFFAAVPPLYLTGTIAIITASIFPALLFFFLLWLSAAHRKRRSPDDCFARL